MANVGSVDRLVRAIAGAILLVAPFAAPALFESIGAWRFAVAAAGAVLLATAALRFCPAYVPLGINTCGVDKR